MSDGKRGALVAVLVGALAGYAVVCAALLAGCVG